MKSNHLKKIIIGTAHFGQTYGIKKINISEDDAREIILLSKSLNIDLVDTSPSYGEAEAILGKSNLKKMSVITKLPQMPLEVKNKEKWISEILCRSLKKLNLSSFHAVLFHDPQIFYKNEAKQIYKILCKLKEEKILSSVGASIYSPKILKKIFPEYKLDIIQAPINLFDQRILSQKYLDLLKKNKVDIHARSIFLQGLLLDEKNFESKYFLKWKKKFLEVKKIASNNNISLLELCLGFINSNEHIEKFLIGIDSINQLKMIASSLNKQILIEEDLKFLSSNDKNLIDPRRW